MLLPGMTTLSDDLNRKLEKRLRRAERQNTVVVRAAWLSEANPPAVKMFCEPITRDHCDAVQGLRCITEGLIKYGFLHSFVDCLAEKIDSLFNAQPELDPDIMEKFMIVSSVMIGCSSESIKD